MKTNVLLVAVLAMTVLSGCQTIRPAISLTEDVPYPYNDFYADRGEKFIGQCQSGIRQLPAAKEAGYGQMVITPTFGEDDLCYWYAYAYNNQICILVNGSFDDAQLTEVQNFGQNWRAQRVDQIVINGKIWAEKQVYYYMAVPYTVIACPLTGQDTQTELITMLRSLIGLGWLGNVTIQ